MEHNFLWYGVSVFVNDILYRDNIFLDELDVTDISEKIKDNTFKFLLKVNNIPCYIVYTFSSNVAIEGTLKITNMQSGISDQYAVERCNDSIRISQGTDYHEIYCYLGKRFIDIIVKNDKKIEVTNLAIVDSNNTNACKVSVCNTAITNENRINKYDKNIDRLLFAVSGAIDYDITRCQDVICFSCSSLKMVVYNSGSLQVICIDTFTGRGHNLGEIHPINSNFKQYFEYDIDQNKCEITEFIETVDNPKTVRRKYLYGQDPETRIIDIEGQRFAVVHKGNDITFVRE